MALDDRGIVVGITTYPDFNGLEGPEYDAKEFYDWLVSTQGGDVPPSRVDYIVSSAFQPPNTAAPTKQPNANDIEALRFRSPSIQIESMPHSWWQTRANGMRHT